MDRFIFHKIYSLLSLLSLVVFFSCSSPLDFDGTFNSWDLTMRYYGGFQRYERHIEISSAKKLNYTVKEIIYTKTVAEYVENIVIEWEADITDSELENISNLMEAVDILIQEDITSCGYPQIADLGSVEFSIITDTDKTNSFSCLDCASKWPGELKDLKVALNELVRKYEPE